MKKEVRVAAVQFAAEQAILNESKKGANVKRVVQYIRQLGPSHDLLVFPELSTTGYIPSRGYLPQSKIQFWKLAEDPESSPTLQEIKDEVDKAGCVCILGFPEKTRIKYEIFNSAALMEPGQPTRIYRKIHIPVEETHYFTPGSRTQVFSTHVGKIGIAICYDYVFPEIVRVLGVQGAEIVVIILCFPNIGNLKVMGEYVTVARALENQVHLVFCNSAGKIGGARKELTLCGDSKIVNSLGEIVARAPTAQECIISATLTEEQLEQGASILPVFKDRQIHAYRPLIEPLD
ncbi:MAG: carbon-nitrogen hydrolase family protein [Chloroflexi bacterium]|nr:carbon-nitrogen hydrolase family protein [Chloroflexota bacterium]MBM3172246.1 carbon-nitrogen hydrolase family protein [Chloroflexota bacterium]MBM3174654.1 carbon-nitrogen hydrolase family protein [Chloroflexota bacterium]MBM4450021.1 carbon-nitrogen hydrolase family protein [Chloroflexota bacterium]